MFDVMLNERTVGTASVNREGLYYHFSCKCILPDKDIHAIWVLWEGGSRKLGVCVPEGRYAYLNTKVPVKYIPGGKLYFRIDHREELDFYPVDPDVAFAHMDKLTKARFAEVNGKPGLVIK